MGGKPGAHQEPFCAPFPFLVTVSHMAGWTEGHASFLRCKVQYESWEYCFNNEHLIRSSSLLIHDVQQMGTRAGGGTFRGVGFHVTPRYEWQSGPGLSCLASCLACHIVQRNPSPCLSSFAIRVCVQEIRVPFWGIPGKSWSFSTRLLLCWQKITAYPLILFVEPRQYPHPASLQARLKGWKMRYRYPSWYGRRCLKWRHMNAVGQVLL